MPKGGRQGRDLTDDSLRAERESSDRATAKRQGDLEKKADKVVESARERADAVLDTARDKADQQSQALGAGASARAAVAGGRALEDETLREERAVADERLRRERSEQARRLAALRPLEREKTDRDLLTERVRSDDQLAHRDDFLGMVSQDLRSLLGGFVMEASLLSEEASDSAEGRRTVAAVKRLERYAARMSGLIGDLVDVVSLEAGKFWVMPMHQDAAAILVESVETFMPTAAEKGIALRCETGSSLLSANVDSERMLQVLANLITNALKFTARGGSILLRGERGGDELRVSVTDTGRGIPSQLLEAIFERFWQAGNNDRRGLGLGLYISRGIIDAHGGRIWAESKPGEGSSFVFTIPDRRPHSA